MSTGPLAETSGACFQELACFPASPVAIPEVLLDSLLVVTPHLHTQALGSHLNEAYMCEVSVSRQDAPCYF